MRKNPDSRLCGNNQLSILARDRGRLDETVAEVKKLGGAYLFSPVPGNYAAHGRFDNRAYGSSIELWLSEHKSQIGWGIAIAAAAAGAMAAKMWARQEGRS